jgi:hypothetical protein
MATNKNKKVQKGSASQLAKLTEPMAQCLAILRGIMAKAEAAPFLEPVAWKELGLLDYPHIIKHPMDLGTIHTQLENGKYVTPDAFSKDVRLVWKNATTYNRPDSEIYTTAERLRKLFDKRVAKVTKTALKRRKDGTIPVITRYDQTRFANLASALTCDELGMLVDMIQKDCPQALIDEDDNDIEIEVGNIDGASLYAYINFAESAIQRRKQVKK